MGKAGEINPLGCDNENISYNSLMEIMGVVSERLQANTDTIKQDMINWLTKLRKQLIEANGGHTEADLQRELSRKSKLLDAYLDGIAQNMVDDEQFDKILSEYINYIFYFEELILTKQYAKAKKMTDLVNALEKIEFGNVRNNGCGAGRTMFAVDIDGTLYPCHRFVGERKFALGNIWTGSDNSKFLKRCATC